MKVIIAGSRTIIDYELVLEAIKDSGFEITEVVSGRARGVDRLGEFYAVKNCISIAKFEAEWSSYGRSAGIIRNKKMADYADALIAVWDGESRGTKNMIEISQKNKLDVYVKLISDENKPKGTLSTWTVF